MSYENINPVKQFNFQINRVLTYGSLACDMQAVRTETAGIRTLADWRRVWLKLGADALEQQQYLHAAYSFRMAEFFMKSDDSAKEPCYEKSIACFYRAFEMQLHLPCEKHSVPFEGKALHCIRIPAPHAKGTLLICGGYDSFIEEFVLQVYELAKQGYEVILFEGPGQGECLRRQMVFRYDFEKPASAVRRV